MKTVFINKVAPPIANKMFDCGLIPWKAGGWAADRNDV
jgi:hypothetical protein